MKVSRAKTEYMWLNGTSLGSVNNNNNNNIFILYSAKSMYSSKRFTIKRCDIASLKLIRNVKCAINLLNNTTLCANWSLPWGVLRS